MIGRAVPLVLSLGLAACTTVGALPAEAPAFGNAVLLAESRCGPGDFGCDRTERRHGRLDPLVVLVEDGGLRAVDPLAGEVRWWRPLPVMGHPVANATIVFVPVRGNELAAIDRWTGELRFRVPLPGEATTGLTVTGATVVATVIGSTRGRSEIVALSGADGRPLWSRSSASALGVPAAKGKIVWVPQGRQVLALHRRSGRELARVDAPETEPDAPWLERVDVQGHAILAGRSEHWFDLRAATSGRGATERSIEAGYATPFPVFAGVDPGHGDDERTRLWIDFPADAGPPREAVLLGRRAVVAFRLAPDGTPARARWAWLAEDRREVVALDVGDHRVTLVREDGSLVVLARDTGEELDRLTGGGSVRGALVLDMGHEPVPTESRPRHVAEADVRAQLIAMLEDVDPRLLPVQKLSARLLWRDEAPSARRTIQALARGELRSEPGFAAEELRAHVLDLTRGAWGIEDDADASLRALSRRASFLHDEHPVVAPLAREVARSGRPEVVPHLVEHLLHPATRDTDLTEIARALVVIDHPAALEGVATFVRRYHADPQVVHASRALQLCIDFLVAQVRPDGASHPDATLARAVLHEVWSDPFTDPSLRAHIGPRLPKGDAKQAAERRPPQLPDVLHLGL